MYFYATYFLGKKGDFELKATNSIVVQKDGYETILYPQLCQTEPVKGTILLLHGMAEHHKRYQIFTDYLNSCGYDVYRYNHRGHGTDQKLEDLGYIADNDGYKILISDAINVLTYLKENNRTNKLILIGHSMGSLVSRNVMQFFKDLDCAVLIGTAFNPRTKSRIGIACAHTIKKFKGSRHYSVFLNKQMFETKHYTSLSERTNFDWLSRNNPNVGAYIHDPYCGFQCSISFYEDLANLDYHAGLPKRIKLVRKDLPILFTSGTKDPVSRYGKDVERLFMLHKRLGFQKVDCIMYKDCRHELLNELNAEEIMKDIEDWITKHI